MWIIFYYRFVEAVRKKYINLMIFTPSKQKLKQKYSYKNNIESGKKSKREERIKLKFGI